MENHNKNKRVGVILARMQPVHLGHLALIEKAMRENDEVYIFIGSADKFNARNPLPIHLRMSLTENAIQEMVKERFNLVYPPYKIVPLDDLTDESDNSHDWGFYLYSKIVTETQSSNFTIYYSDGYEIITTWFPGFILRNNVSLSLLARGGTVDGISATKIRNAILFNEEETLLKYVPTVVYENRATIKQHIELSKLIN